MGLVYCGGVGALDVRVDQYVACMAVVGLCPGVDVEKREQDTVCRPTRAALHEDPVQLFYATEYFIRLQRRQPTLIKLPSYQTS
jgi:hypothetical protein